MKPTIEFKIKIFQRSTTEGPALEITENIQEDLISLEAVALANLQLDKFKQLLAGLHFDDLIRIDYIGD